MTRALTERARQVRRAPTPSEDRLWQALRGRALGGRFYRQKPIGPFVPDFVCERPHLVVEVDGPVHDRQVERDAERRRCLEDSGYPVLRVSAAEVEEGLDCVLARIRATLSTQTVGSR